MSDFGQPPGGGGFGGPPGGGGFGPPPGGFGPPPGGFGPPPGGGGGGFGPPPDQGGGAFGAPPGGAFGGAPPGGAAPKTETLALVSTICGVLSFATCCPVLGCCLFPLPIVAIVTGVLGLNKIKADANLKGKELAFVGIGLGGFILLVDLGLFIFNLATSGMSAYTNPNMNF